MEASGIDCLVLCSAGASWMYDGNWRYIIGDQLRSNPQIDFVVFPIDGEPTLILDYGLKRHLAEKSWTPNVEAPSDPRGRDPRGKNSSSLGNFTVSLSSVVRASRRDKGTIGITPASLPTIHYEEMKANLPEVTFADCSRMMMDVRCIKSPEEIRLISAFGRNCRRSLEDRHRGREGGDTRASAGRALAAHGHAGRL